MFILNVHVLAFWYTKEITIIDRQKSCKKHDSRYPINGILCIRSKAYFVHYFIYLQFLYRQKYAFNIEG